VDGKFGIGLVLSGKTSFMHVLQPNVQAIALVTSDHFRTATIVADFFLSDDHPLEIGAEIPLFSYEAYSGRTLVDINGQDYPLTPFNRYILLELEAVICRFVDFRRPSGRVTGLNNRVMQLAAVEISRRVAEEDRAVRELLFDLQTLREAGITVIANRDGVSLRGGQQSAEAERAVQAVMNAGRHRVQAAQHRAYREERGVKW
jgi:hypothetical protein